MAPQESLLLPFGGDLSHVGETVVSNVKEINGALAAFLGRFSSRNADYQGYWLIPFLLDTESPLVVDLLADEATADGARGFAANFARTTLAEQLHHIDRSPAELESATLHIASDSNVTHALAGEYRRKCFPMRLVVEVRTRSGRRFTRDKSLLVAPFDPNLARRSTRGTSS